LRTLVSASLALSAVLTLSAAPLGAPAAGSGLGYDSVTKFQMGQGGSGAAPAPGTFGPDWATASNPPKASGGGMFGKLMGSMQNMGAMFKTGTAERHYYGTTKYRTDNLSQGTGDITDCTARTLTHLDLNAKTYHITSLDQPETTGKEGPSSSGPAPAATDDGTKIAVDVTTKMIGSMTIEGVATNGYVMNMKMTITKADGESNTSNQTITAYYSDMADPRGYCPSSHLPIAMPSAGGPGGARGGASMAQMMLAMQALTGKGDSRFKITNSGPPLPGGKLAMWQLVTMGSTGGSSGGFGVETERGNVHPLGDSDPAFSPPPDFTKV